MDIVVQIRKESSKFNAALNMLYEGMKMFELLLTSVLLSTLIIHVLVREILVNSVRIYESNDTNGKTNSRMIYQRWADVIIQQRTKFGIGTTGPFLVMIILALIETIIAMNISESTGWLFLLALFSFGYTLFTTCITIGYSYKGVALNESN